MKRWTVVLICLLAVCLIFAASVVAQDKKQEKTPAKKFKVDDKFMTTWKKVGKLTKEVRSFKTEKATTVAGVRGAEAEDEAVKHLYFKGGSKYPSRLELKNAITLLDAFIKENPDDESVPQSQYFISQCHVQLGDVDKGIKAYEFLVSNYSTSEYAEAAKEEIKKLKERK